MSSHALGSVGTEPRAHGFEEVGGADACERGLVGKMEIECHEGGDAGRCRFIGKRADVIAEGGQVVARPLPVIFFLDGVIEKVVANSRVRRPAVGAGQCKAQRCTDRLVIDEADQALIVLTTESVIVKQALGARRSHS